MATIVYFTACLASLYLGYAGFPPGWVAAVAALAVFKAYGHRTLGDELREARRMHRAFSQTRALLLAYLRALIDCGVYFVLGFAWTDLLQRLG